MYINSNDYFPLGFGAEFFQALPVVQQQCQALKANLFTGTQNIKPCFHALVTADKLFYHHWVYNDISAWQIRRGRASLQTGRQWLQQLRQPVQNNLSLNL